MIVEWERNLMRLAPALTVSSDRFTFHKQSGILSAEASDFYDLPRAFEQRIYDDACDIGVHVRSARTGNIETFYFEKEVRDAENELIGWVYRPLNKNLNLKIQIWND